MQRNDRSYKDLKQKQKSAIADKTYKMHLKFYLENQRMPDAIAMTANAFTEDRIKAKEAGMDEHVAKPVDMELLIKVIHRLVK